MTGRSIATSPLTDVATTRVEGGVDAVDRALSILASFSPDRDRQTLAQLATATGLYKSTILRLARSLTHGGYMHRGDDGIFSLGPQPLRLAAVYKRGLKLGDRVRPVLRSLVVETGESASFFRREGDRRLCLYREETLRAIRDSITEGDLLPLDRGAAGHVLTRAADEPRASATPLVVSIGERDAETAAIAAAVYGHDGLAGALTLSGPCARFDADRVATMSECLLTQARHLTRTLGGRW